MVKRKVVAYGVFIEEKMFILFDFSYGAYWLL